MLPLRFPPNQTEYGCFTRWRSRGKRGSIDHHFRILLVGYFEGIDSECGLEWRCADSLALCEFLRLGERGPVRTTPG